MKSWFGCTPAEDWVSMGVFSDGSYGTPEGVMFSFPVTTKEGRWSIVQVRLLFFFVAMIPLMDKVAIFVGSCRRSLRAFVIRWIFS